MKYIVTAYLRSGPVVATIEADTFFDAIRAHRRALMKLQETKLERDHVWNARIVAVKDGRP